MNEHRLQQDHPCVIDNIRKQFLKLQAPKEEYLVPKDSNKSDPSVGQATAVLGHLNNKVIKIKKFLTIVVLSLNYA